MNQKKSYYNVSVKGQVITADVSYLDSIFLCANYKWFALALERRLKG